MQVKAIARYTRVSPQKVRKVAGAIKGKPVEAGLNALQFMPQKSAAIIAKVIRSAAANAEVEGMDVDELTIKVVTADQGPSLKRFRARAQGRGARIIKRTSHITVVLEQ